MFKVFAALVASVMAAPVSASTPDTLLDLRQPRIVASALQEAGYRAEVKTNDKGEPYVLSAANGSDFTIEFYGCNKLVDCDSYQFASWYKPEAIFTPALANDWNMQKRFLKVAVGAKGELNEYMDMTAVGKTSYGNFKDIVEWYVAMDIELGKFLTAKRPAAAK